MPGSAAALTASSRAAAELGRPAWDRLAACSIIDFWVRRSGDGHCHTAWHRNQRRWADTDHDQRRWTDAGPAEGIVYVRDQSEARSAVVSAVR